MRTIKAKTYYFCDAAWSYHFDSIEEEFETVVARKCREADIEFRKVTCVDLPPFDESYSILFFDWGGMMMGNDLLGSFCREILRQSEDRPNTDYVMTSSFTQQAMEDAKETFGKDTPNIFLSVDDWIRHTNDVIASKVSGKDVR